MYGTHNNPEAAANAARIHDAALYFTGGAAAAAVLAPVAIEAGAAISETAAYAALAKGGAQAFKWAFQPNPTLNVHAAGADAASQISDKGIQNWNPVSSFANGYFQNPGTQSIPGAMFNLSYNTLSNSKAHIYSNILTLPKANNIMWNTIGNVYGDKL